MSTRARGAVLLLCLALAAALFLSGVTGRGASGFLLAVAGPVASLTAGLFAWSGRRIPPRG